MVLSWSLTEVVRYSFYACSLLGREPPVLLFLRYTLFYTLYPSGASSEALLIYTTLPKPALGLHADLHANVREVLFAIWWPGACAFGHRGAWVWRGVLNCIFGCVCVCRAVCNVHAYDQAAAQDARRRATDRHKIRVRFQDQVVLTTDQGFPSDLALVPLMGYPRRTPSLVGESLGVTKRVCVLC